MHLHSELDRHGAYKIPHHPPQKKKMKKQQTHLVEQKDAGIGQGHPQVTGLSVSTAPQLEWKKATIITINVFLLLLLLFTVLPQPLKAPSRASPPSMFTSDDDVSAAARRLTWTRSSGGICALKPPARGSAARWSMAAHRATRTDTRMDRLRLSLHKLCKSRTFFFSHSPGPLRISAAVCVEFLFLLLLLLSSSSCLS